ncbi:MAG TPA: NAD(P)H-dependent oxidoreductase, partial [Nakamurella sp.]
MTTFTVAVVSAGLGQPSSTRLLADQLAGAVRTAVAGRGDRVEVITLELRELAHDITDNLLTGFPSVALHSALDAVGSADAAIAVTPVFSGSYSGLFKSFFDV